MAADLHVLTADRRRVIFQGDKVATAKEMVEAMGLVCALDGTYLPRCDREQYDAGRRPDRSLTFV